MRKLERLKREGRGEASFRGHDLGRFETTPHGALAQCKCGAYVQVLRKPLPNEINLGGDALAIGCDHA